VSGPGSELLNPHRGVFAFDDATGKVTITSNWNPPDRPTAASTYAMHHYTECGWAPQITGGNTFYFGTLNPLSYGGLITQVEALNSRMTANRVANAIEQQAFTYNLFRYAIDPGWSHFAITWDEGLDQVWQYYQGQPIISDITLTQPMTGLGAWTVPVERAHIGSLHPTGTFVTSKHWHGGVCDLATGTEVLNASDVARLANR